MAAFFHSLLPLLLFLFLFLFLSFPSRLAADPPPNLSTNFSCASDSGPNSSCKAYVSYFVQSRDFLDLEKISVLFGVNSAEIANASNLESVDHPLFPHQLLLIPVICGCTNNHFFANLTYRIQKLGENYYIISTTMLENLTIWQLVEDLNPSLKPNLIHVGDEVIFPLFCKCPSQKDKENGINYLITYVWQPMDDVLQVSHKFNSSPFDILNENKYQSMDSVVNLPVMIPVSALPDLSQSFTFPENVKNGNRSILIYVGSFGGSVLIFAVVIGLICFGRSLRKNKSLKWKNSSLEISDVMNRDPENQISKPKAMQDKLLSVVSDSLGKPVLYESKTILEATMNFNESCRIGGFVYRAAINGQILAVKSRQEDITEEVKILQKVNHVNLVKLMGFSPNIDGNCFLVYEYAENGSLDKWLFSSSAVSSSFQGCLPWSRRLQIALDVANGLHYMHEHVRPNIVHRDLRSENVLLDSDFKAKIANFSTAKPATTSVSPKVDVLAFGIVLLELLSGKKAVGAKENGEMVMAWKEIRGVLEMEEEREETLSKWMDPKLGGSYSISGALSMAGLAKACTSDLPMARPSISEIVFNLSVLVQSANVFSQKSWVFGLEAEVGQRLNPLSPR